MAILANGHRIGRVRVVGHKDCVKVDVVKGGVRKRVFDCTKVFVLPKQTKPFVLRTLIDKWIAANHITAKHITVSNSEYQPRMVTNDMKGLHVTFVNEVKGTICGEAPGADAIVISKNTGGGTFKLINHGWIFGAGGNGGKGGDGARGVSKSGTYTHSTTVTITVKEHYKREVQRHHDLSDISGTTRYITISPGAINTPTATVKSLPVTSSPAIYGHGYINAFGGHVTIKAGRSSTGTTVYFQAKASDPGQAGSAHPQWPPTWHVNHRKHNYKAVWTFERNVPITGASGVSRINFRSSEPNEASTVHFSFAGGSIGVSFYLIETAFMRPIDKRYKIVYSFSGSGHKMAFSPRFRCHETWTELEDAVRDVVKTIPKSVPIPVTVLGGNGGAGGAGGTGAYYNHIATDGHDGTTGGRKHSHGIYGGTGGHGGKGGHGGVWGQAGLRGGQGGSGAFIGAKGSPGSPPGAAIRGAKNMTSDSNPGTATGKPTIGTAYGGYRGLVIK